jgi:hypothetical protein
MYLERRGEGVDNATKIADKNSRRDYTQDYKIRRAS